jgi:hypothetical protein
VLPNIHSCCRCCLVVNRIIPLQNDANMLNERAKCSFSPITANILCNTPQLYGAGWIAPSSSHDMTAHCLMRVLFFFLMQGLMTLSMPSC